MSIHVAWIRCDCGKLHATAGTSQRSLCTCGRRLWPMVWDLKHRPGIDRATACNHRMCDEPDGLPCTRETHSDRGHTYRSSAGSELGEGAHHHEPTGDDQ